MTSVVIGMLVCVAAAAVILLVVAVPKLRDGAPLLTEEGEDAVREARRRTRALAAQARKRARDAAQQAAQQAAAARERAAAAVPRVPAVEGNADVHMRPDVQADSDAQATSDVQESADVQASPAAQPAQAPKATVTDTVRFDVQVVQHPEADAPDVIDLRPYEVPARRGAHRRLNDITWGEPPPGPRHGR